MNFLNLYKYCNLKFGYFDLPHSDSGEVDLIDLSYGLTSLTLWIDKARCQEGVGGNFRI